MNPTKPSPPGIRCTSLYVAYLRAHASGALRPRADAGSCNAALQSHLPGKQRRAPRQLPPAYPAQCTTAGPNALHLLASTGQKLH